MTDREQEQLLATVTDRFERRLSEEMGSVRIAAVEQDSATRQEIANLRIELSGRIAGLRTELAEHIGGLRAETSGQIGGLRADLSQQIGGLRAETSGQIAGLRADVSEQIGGLRAETSGQIAGLRADLSEQIGGLRAETSGQDNAMRLEMSRFRLDMSEQFAESRVHTETRHRELLKWAFVFWVGQAAAVAGIVSAFT